MLFDCTLSANVPNPLADALALFLMLIQVFISPLHFAVAAVVDAITNIVPIYAEAAMRAYADSIGSQKHLCICKELALYFSGLSKSCPYYLYLQCSTFQISENSKTLIKE